MDTDSTSGLPPYTYVPGGPWPHPNRAREAAGERDTPPLAVAADARLFRRGVELFDAGFYWEAHEAWEALWHAAGRRGPTADVLRGLIKLAAAGIKVRERREPGVRTHARRAAECFAAARQQSGVHQLGLDLDLWIERALAIAENPPADPGPLHSPVTRVFAFRIASSG
jgi:predicted metal-dependent hydrolase